MYSQISHDLFRQNRNNVFVRHDLQDAMAAYRKSNERLIEAVDDKLTGREINIESGCVDYGTMGWTPETSAAVNWHSWYRNPRHPRNEHESNMLRLSGMTTVLGAIALNVPERDDPNKGIDVVHLILDGTTGVADESLMTEDTFSARQQIATRFDRLVFYVANQRLATSL